MPKNKWGQEKHFLLYEAPFASYSQVKIEKSPKIWLRQEKMMPTTNFAGKKFVVDIIFVSFCVGTRKPLKIAP